MSEVRNGKGEDYPGETLYSLITSIQCHLRNNYGRNKQLIDKTGRTFRQMNSALNYQMKLAAASGLGVERKQAQVISADQDEVLWKSGVLSDHSPKTLRDTLLWTLGLYFGLRGGQEHRNLRFDNSQLAVKVDEHGRRYLQYTEDISKTNQGGLAHRLIKPKVCRAYENANHPERCPVRLYEVYRSHCPSKNASNALYLRALENPNGNVWYGNQPAGRETLGNVVSNLMKEAKMDGFYTNHSLRATLATRLYEAGVDEQLIQESTGHRSVEGVRNYKRSNSNQKFDVHKKVRCETIVSADENNNLVQTPDSVPTHQSEITQTKMGGTQSPGKTVGTVSPGTQISSDFSPSRAQHKTKFGDGPVVMNITIGGGGFSTSKTSFFIAKII